MPRDTFDEAAELYDRARPGYPAALVGELVSRSGLSSTGRVLEVGTGTGQLTVPLAGLGCWITAVELVPALAAVARRNLRPFPRAHVDVCAFERWDLPQDPFDLVVSATAFHWIDPVVRVAKAAAALRPDGMLALVTTHHVAGGSGDLFAQAQRCYERRDPATSAGLLVGRGRGNFDTREAGRSSEFGPVEVHRYAQEITYSTSAYLDLPLTYSGHRALEASAREGLLSCIGDLTDRRHGGSVTKRYLHELITARRTA
ncbi:class I SAM-dependent methyltransferase [Streptomyces sp. NBC_01433]|uniref:class I SAM-dependent methyltransferase n=1 Tax=Streptomyces sp. NBC_01433 TaxID=2903864 RepID=UPI002253D21A|nr:class I SAM-dependent methyltransferase [Streptomyces sp. NBC_01433]MCX4681029.1 class I SAM-dependent methyltransferase [Streptomyces sp. NBC_01433]